MKITMTLQGIKELERQLKRAGPAILDEVAPTVQQAAHDLMTDAQATVPTGGGTLGSSSFVGDVEVKRSSGTVGTSVGYTAEHAPYVHEGFHWGQERSGPPLWLAKAATAMKSKYTQMLAQAVRDGLKRLGM